MASGTPSLPVAKPSGVVNKSLKNLPVSAGVPIAALFNSGKIRGLVSFNVAASAKAATFSPIDTKKSAAATGIIGIVLIVF